MTRKHGRMLSNPFLTTPDLALGRNALIVSADAAAARRFALTGSSDAPGDTVMLGDQVVRRGARSALVAIALIGVLQILFTCATLIKAFYDHSSSERPQP